MFSKALVVICLAAVAFSKPVARSLQVHETRQQVPAAFTVAGPASPDTVLNLRIALVSSDMAGLEKALYDVSTPGSALYGQHLTKEEVEQFVSPTPETVEAVTTWLKENDIEATKASPAGDWLSIAIPVSKANELFDADFSVFTHSKTGVQSIRTLSYSIPTDLKEKLDFVHPTTVFAQPFSGPQFNTPIVRPQVNVTSDAVPSSCGSTITPACLQALYGIPTTSNAISTNVLGVSGFIDQFAQKSDLKSFLGRLRTDLSSSTTFALQTLDGGSNPQSASEAGIEANLDIQYTVGVASKVPVTFISVGDNNSDGINGFLDIIQFLLNETTPPTVLTTSYGFNEPDLTSSVANNLCNAYMQLGARGTSILFASGDGGVSGSQSQSCTTFIPTFPSGCPFLTSVGATTGITETAADFSSGGFSAIFSQPSYQSSAVSTYLTALGSTNSGKFTKTGRAFPDVSAQGENVEISDGGSFGTVDGTSCSSPIFASVIALLNDQRAAAGKSSLGFLNPFLYSSAGTAALNDVTTGSNPGCNTNGFPAKAGWDPVTGLGTPNFAKLLSATANL